jgi:hypothetical protein
MEIDGSIDDEEDASATTRSECKSEGDAGSL